MTRHKAGPSALVTQTKGLERPRSSALFAGAKARIHCSKDGKGCTKLVGGWIGGDKT